MQYPTKRAEILRCAHCKCTWLETVTIGQYSNMQAPIYHDILPNQFNSAVILRCANCGRPVLPDISMYEMSDKDYSAYMDALHEAALSIGASAYTDAKDRRKADAETFSADTTEINVPFDMPTPPSSER